MLHASNKTSAYWPLTFDYKIKSPSCGIININNFYFVNDIVKMFNLTYLSKLSSMPIFWRSITCTSSMSLKVIARLQVSFSFLFSMLLSSLVLIFNCFWELINSFYTYRCWLSFSSHWLIVIDWWGFFLKRDEENLLKKIDSLDLWIALLKSYQRLHQHHPRELCLNLNQQTFIPLSHNFG